MTLDPCTVYCAVANEKSYVDYSTAHKTLTKLFEQAGLDDRNYGSAGWNPLGEIIGRNERVVIKPNWVTHANLCGEGTDCLVTHTSVIEAIARFSSKAQPHSIILGDAPVQGCDFAELDKSNKISAMRERLAAENIEVSVRDFRQSILPEGKRANLSKTTGRTSEDYVLFDLAAESALEPISDYAGSFRVTMYDPRELNRTHAPGKHRYLIAREVLEAEVFINVPKLKTHKKAGVTGALKNVVGINGLKDYLPHHRKGGSNDGGDCYEGKSVLKGLTEEILDAANKAKNPVLRSLFDTGARIGYAVGRVAGNDNNLEGSWYGNDTVWRMALDLQRIVHFGRTDGTLSSNPQRKVITITDAVIAGEGEGPLAPSPIPLGMLTLAPNVCAADWVHALLMRLDPHRIPIIARSFDAHRFALSDFMPREIKIMMNGKLIPPAELIRNYSRRFTPPSGWAGQCELDVENP